MSHDTLKPMERLEYLRGEIDAERISTGEILELQSLAEHIDPGDVQLLEWAGVPEGGYVQYKCMVACTNANGEPDLFFCIVECSEEEYDEGDHYDAVKIYAAEQGYEAPMVAFDQNDSAGKAMLDLFVWESATTIKAKDWK